MMKNQNVFQAFRNAFDGLRVLASEHAARREMLIAIAALILLGIDLNEFTLIVFVLSMLLLAVESLNTAIEEMCNFMTEAYDPRIKRIKDLGAAAILIISIAIGIVFAAYSVTKFL